jgi:hypothetical protein
MAIQANNVHVRVVQAHNAFQAHPTLHAFMQPALKDALMRRAQLLEPLLKAAGGATDQEEEAAASIETVFALSHDLIVRIHKGAAYRYHAHTEGLAALAPIRVGRDPAEDEVRLATLIEKLPTLQPAFQWLPDEGLTLAALQKQLKAHRDALVREKSLGGKDKGVREALAVMREERKESQKLWEDEGGKLEAWIIANVPENQQYAFGRERRSKQRAAKTEPIATTTSAPGK